MTALTLLGRDHTRYGRLHHQAISPDVAAAMSVGATPTARSALAKVAPNEDALLVIDDEQRVLLAVADAHFGLEASHAFITHLAQASPDADSVTEHLRDALFGEIEGRSATTLTVAWFDRATGQGGGLAFGDSSAVIVDGDGARRLFVRNNRYIRPGDFDALRWAVHFEFTLPSDALLALFTDGVDECHYRKPATSVGLPHLEDLFASTRGDPAQFARRLGAKALNGVDDNPGGEDNIAIAIARR